MFGHHSYLLVTLFIYLTTTVTSQFLPPMHFTWNTQAINKQLYYCLTTQAINKQLYYCLTTQAINKQLYYCLTYVMIVIHESLVYLLFTSKQS